jgi:hypothetical protein
MKNILIKIVYLLILIHFLKDFVQDILCIPSIFDNFPNVNEDLNIVPPILSYLSYFTEFIILILIPLGTQNKFKNKIINVGLIITGTFLLIYFFLAIYFDPNINSFL